MILDEYKQLYKQNADLIKDWRKLSKTELCNKYVEALNNNDVNQESYLSAIIYSFWYIVSRTYWAQRYKLASEEDVYEWFIEGILKALKDHVWTNPSNALYNDENGPEKAISVCIYSLKINFFTALNCQKRKVVKDSLSLDELQENASDDYYLPYQDEELYKDSFLYKKVVYLFNDQNYFQSFLLDAIINADVFSKEECNDSYCLSTRKLMKHLRNFDDNQCKFFSVLYNVDLNEVKIAVDFMRNLTPDRMQRNINNSLFLFGKDKNLISYVRG